MTRHDPHIYPGEYVTCIHNPDRALCRKHDEHGPSLPDCQPFACRNVALTISNIDALAQRKKHLLNMISQPTAIGPYLLHRLEGQPPEITEFLAKASTRPGGDSR